VTYAELLAAMYSARRFGVKLGLAPMEDALARLGHPEKRLGVVVHVAGTNGKGSTCAFVESALRAAGHKTGLFTSPHLVRFTERIRVGGMEVDGEALARRYHAHREILEALTFFERATLLALLSFADEGTDVVVLEVGLGGRLDATNAVDAEVAVVTGVAMDHMDVLGPDLQSIAREKAGIFKPRREAVLGACGEPTGRPMLFDLAREAGVRDVTLAASVAPLSWQLGLRGAHQAKNAACALAALDALERATAGRLRVSLEARRRGLAQARWPGRLEEIAADPRIWLDAAHNPQGAQALAAAVRAERPLRLVAIVGASADKDVAGVLEPIVGLADVVIATQSPSERAMPAIELGAIAATQSAPPGRVLIVEPDLRRALGTAGAAAHRDGDLVVVYGSLFLVGAVRALLTGEPVDPVSAQDPSTQTPPLG
jgi:dihydrofolate synthase/folylpolyglutamate synthase